tara:strand:+ start:669 stop:875 length:207 start_codon:yes stop_codon:yes gene_type:complete
MPTPEQYDKSRDEIRQQIRETLGMKVPESSSNLPSMKNEVPDNDKPVDVQILEEIKAIKEILQKLLDR